MPHHSTRFASYLSSRSARASRRRRPTSPFEARLRAFDRGEVARLRAHFRGVIAELSRRDVADLAPPQRAARAALIAELSRYARRGRFPRNLDFAGQRMPYFVDAFGTRCAMAHLIEHTGATAFVQRIATQKNNAFIAEIEHDPQLVAWLAQAGLSAAEAARIQPSYCDIPLGDLCVCGHQTTSTGPLLEATVLFRESNDLIHARVTTIHWQQSGQPSEKPEAPGPEVQGNYVEGVHITTWAGGEAQPGDTVLVFANDDPTSGEHEIGPGMLLRDGMAVAACMKETPELSKEDAIAALMNADGTCGETLAAIDPEWAAPQCVNYNACSTGVGESASLALPGMFSLVAAVWAGRRAARRRITRAPRL